MVELKELKKEFENGFIALKEIDLKIEEKECLILKGVSGSGKSTLLSILAGLERPTSGAVEIDGINIAKIPEKHLDQYRQKKVGIVFQSFNLISHLTLFENVLAPLIPLDLPKEKKIKRAKEVIKLAKIEHKSFDFVSTLSGGEKQRCAIARALINDPPLLLFDEPTANLDKENSQNLIHILEDLYKRQKTIIIATHDPIFDQLPFKTRKVILEDGKICK